MQNHLCVNLLFLLIVAVMMLACICVWIEIKEYIKRRDIKKVKEEIQRIEIKKQNERWACRDKVKARICEGLAREYADEESQKRILRQKKITSFKLELNEDLSRDLYYKNRRYGYKPRHSRYMILNVLDNSKDFNTSPNYILLERMYEKYETNSFTPEQLDSMIKYLQGYEIIVSDVDAKQHADDFIDYWEYQEVLIVERDEDQKETK